MTAQQAQALLETLKFTPTQKKIVKVLADGESHSWQELYDSLGDNLTEPNLVGQHVYNIRLVLKKMGMDIVNRHKEYRIVRHISTDDT